MAILSLAAVRWRTRPAYLNLMVTPPDAGVMLDGRPLTLTEGCSLIEDSPGRHQLSIRAEGHEPQERFVDLMRGRDNALRANIRLQSCFGRLHVVSTPEGAAVEVLDQNKRVAARGTTPFYSPRLRRGEYTLRFTKDLCAAHQVRAFVPAGERTAEVPPVVLPLAEDAEDSLRALAFLQALQVPWKGAARYDDPAWTFGEFLNEVTRLHGIPLTVNAAAFNVEGLEERRLLATPICEKVLDLGPKAKELSLRTVLEKVFDLVFNVPSGVTMVPKKMTPSRYGLEVTTGRDMLANPVVILHPVTDLVQDSRGLSGPQLVAIIERQLPLWSIPADLSYRYFYDLDEPIPYPPPALHFLTRGSALHVVSNWRAQEAVHDFLNQLRLARRTRGTIPALLRPVGELTESTQLLKCLRSGWLPWKGKTRYADPKMTLEQFLKAVSRQHGVEITVNERAFEAEGWDGNKLRTSPVFEEPLDLGRNATKLSVRAVLRQVLNRVENIPSGVTFVPKKLADRIYGWEVTTGAFLATESITVLHPVGDLVRRGISGEQLVRAIRMQLPFWDYMNLIPGWDPELDERPPVREVHLDFLSVGGVLRMTHNWRVQEAVDSFLTQLRQTIRTHGAPPDILRPTGDPTDSSRLLACARASWGPWKGPRELGGSLTLRQFLRLVSRYHGVEVVFNEQAFEVDTPNFLDYSIGKGKVSFNPKWSARAVLLDVVKRLRIQGGAVLVPRKLAERTFGWEVTTPAAAENEQLTVLHPVGDLLAGPGALSKEQLMATVRGQLPLRERAVASVEFSPLAQAVVVSYNWRVQALIDSYLNQLRQLRRPKTRAP